MTEKTEWLESQMQRLRRTSTVRFSGHATYSSVAMAVPRKGREFRMVADYRAANVKVQLVPCPMLSLEVMPSLFMGVPVFYSTDLLQGCWKLPLADEAKNLFPIFLPSGLETSNRVPQGMLNVTAFLQSSLIEIFRGYIDEEVYSGGRRLNYLNYLKYLKYLGGYLGRDGPRP